MDRTRQRTPVGKTRSTTPSGGTRQVAFSSGDSQHTAGGGQQSRSSTPSRTQGAGSSQRAASGTPGAAQRIGRTAGSSPAGSPAAAATVRPPRTPGAGTTATVPVRGATSSWSSRRFAPEVAAARSTRTATAAAKARSKSPQRPRVELLGLDTNEPSPRLLREDSGEQVMGAPLLPPTPTGKGETEDRFCVGGPDLGGCGQARRSSNANFRTATFPEVVARMQAGMGQASLLLNDRLRTLQTRCNAGAILTASQEKELCEIADGATCASYHVQKWAHLFDGNAVQRPMKPWSCEEAEEAIASMHFAMPKLMVNSALAQKGLTAAIKEYGKEKVEERVRKLGIPAEDLRALAPHLERLVMRLGRVSSAVRPGRPLRDFLHEYFGPRLGKKPVERIIGFLAER